MADIVRPGSMANIGGPAAWPTSRPDNVADIRGPPAWPTSRPDRVADIDDVYIDSAAAAEHCIEGGTCKLGKLPKVKMPSRNTCTNELSEGTCAVTKDITAHNDKKCGAARLTRLCRTMCQTKSRARGIADATEGTGMKQALAYEHVHCAPTAPTCRQVRVMPSRLTSSCTLRLRGHCGAYDLRNTSNWANAQGAELQKGRAD